MSYFPLFVELEGEHCLVVGGGRIALQKINALKEFGAQITAVSEAFLPELEAAEGVIRLKRSFLPEDVKGKRLVVTATDDALLNHRISLLCQKERILVNAVDQAKDCSFLFPAYIKEGEVVAAFSSGGRSPVVAQYLKEQTRPVLTKLIGELAAQLGSLREDVKRRVEKEERKAVYQKLLHKGLFEGRRLFEEEILQIMTGGTKWKE